MTAVSFKRLLCGALLGQCHASLRSPRPQREWARPLSLSGPMVHRDKVRVVAASELHGWPVTRNVQMLVCVLGSLVDVSLDDLVERQPDLSNQCP